MLLNFQCERPINLDTGSARVGCSRNRCGIEVVSIINLILHVCSGWNGGGGGVRSGDGAGCLTVPGPPTNLDNS